MKHLTIPTNSKPVLPELSNYLKESITSFSEITGIPVAFFNEHGKAIYEYNTALKVCCFSKEYANASGPCSRNLVTSINYASQLGEPYIFVCHGGLVKIAVALIIDGKILGCLMAGPIIMGSLTERNISKLIKEDSIPPEDYPKLALFINKMKSHTPQEVSYLALLLNNCVLSSVGNAKDYIKINKQHRDQTKLGLDLQKYKKTHKQMNYPYELERQLVQSIKNGDSRDAQDMVKKLINEIYILESGDLTAVKAKMFGLTAILSREVSESPFFSDEPLELDIEDINILYDEQSPEALSREFSVLVGQLAKKFSDNLYNGASEITAKTIQYINRNFRNKISLNKIADILHVNQSYLSMLFKQETGVSFTEYLTSLRIREAKRLLAESNLSMIDISMQCGFDDQSYFTKVFRKSEGITPKQFRKDTRQIV